MQFCCTVALHTGFEPSDTPVDGNTQERWDPVFSPSRESSAAGFDESFHSAECHYAASLNQPTIVSSKRHHLAVIFDHIILSYSN